MTFTESRSQLHKLQDSLFWVLTLFWGLNCLKSVRVNHISALGKPKLNAENEPQFQNVITLSFLFLFLNKCFLCCATQKTHLFNVTETSVRICNETCCANRASTKQCFECSGKKETKLFCSENKIMIYIYVLTE